MLFTTRSLRSKNPQKLGLFPVKITDIFKPYISFSILRCEDAVLTVWLGLGAKNTHVLA